MLKTWRAVWWRPPNSLRRTASSAWPTRAGFRSARSSDAARGRHSQTASCRPGTVRLLYRALRGSEAVGVRVGFRADSLLGLMHPAPNVPHVDHWAECGIALRDFADDAAR